MKEIKEIIENNIEWDGRHVLIDNSEEVIAQLQALMDKRLEETKAACERQLEACIAMGKAKCDKRVEGILGEIEKIMQEAEMWEDDGEYKGWCIFDSEYQALKSKIKEGGDG